MQKIPMLVLILHKSWHFTTNFAPLGWTHWTYFSRKMVYVYSRFQQWNYQIVFTWCPLIKNTIVSVFRWILGYYWIKSFWSPIISLWTSPRKVCFSYLLTSLFELLALKDVFNRSNELVHVSNRLVSQDENNVKS